MKCEFTKEELRELGIVEISFTQLKSLIKKKISMTKDKIQLEKILEMFYHQLKKRRDGENGR